MLIARVVIVSAENSDGICDIGPSGGHHVHLASDHRLVYGRIAGFFVGLPLVKLHRQGCGNWPGLVDSELRQDRPNVAVLIDVNRVMLPSAFDIHAKIDGDTPELMHPEPFFHLIIDLLKEALISHDKVIIDVQNDCGNNCALNLKHEQSSVDT
jgi:hypothetical protein